MRKGGSFLNNGVGGFTLIEMLISVTIFTVIIAAFIGMLVVVTKIGGQQSTATVVSQESQTLLSKVQYYVSTASLVDIPTSTATSTLKLRTASSSVDPTFITLATSTGVVYLQQTATGTLQALTSNRVFVSSLTFTRVANPPGHDVVNVSFTMRNSPQTIGEQISQLFQSSIVHVSAATFDSGVLASGPNELLGNSTYPWNPINGILYFSGNNIGVGNSNPSQPLDVNGGVRLNPTSAGQPSCNSGSNARGTLWFSSGGSGKDSLYLCASTNASGTYAWVQLY